MAIGQKETGKLIMSGAIAGAATPLLLKNIIMPILNAIGQLTPTVTAKLANPALSIDVRGSLTGIQSGLGGWLADAVGISIPASIATTIIMGAIGGALLFLAGAWVSDKFGLLTGNALNKTVITIFTGSIVAGIILGGIALPPVLGMTLINTLIALLINAGILAWLFVAIDKKGSIGLVPY